jgi:hypothetical protein
MKGLTSRRPTPWQLWPSAATSFAIESILLIENPLGQIIQFLVTEFWDRSFSQSEIRAAFHRALADMNRYAAGQERRWIGKLSSASGQRQSWRLD